MEAKTRGWMYIIIGLVAGYFAWTGNDKWAILLLALSLLLSGYHHAFGRK